SAPAQKARLQDRGVSPLCLFAGGSLLGGRCVGWRAGTDCSVRSGAKGAPAGQRSQSPLSVSGRLPFGGLVRGLESGDRLLCPLRRKRRACRTEESVPSVC